MAGVLKSTHPIDKLVKTVTWADRFRLSTVRLIGAVEFLGAVKLIFPWLLHIAPMLTPVAESGLAHVQLLTVFHHAKLKESKAIVFNIFLATFVAYGRFGMLLIIHLTILKEEANLDF